MSVTGFILLVYVIIGMVKETVGTRVPVAIAEQVDRYAETHGISRTEAIELFIRTGFEQPNGYREERTYTGRIREDWYPEPPHRDPEYSWGMGDSIEKRVKRKLGYTESYTGEFEENEALTARLPGEMVECIGEWQKSQDMNRANAACDLLKRGLRADPLPDGHEVSLDGEKYTVRLGPEKADKFRRYRLSDRKTPSEAVSSLLGATRSQKPVSVNWGTPGEE